MLYITIKLITGFILLFIIITFVGRKIINQITPFTFIGSIVIGEFLGNAVYEEHVSILEIIYSISLWGLLLFIVEFLERKFLSFRGIFQGKPSTLIKNGVIDREELNGSLSILKKPQYQKITIEDFNLPEKPVHVPVTLIRDGKVLKDELRDIGFNEIWLKKQLASQNVSNYKDVFLAEWLEGDGIFVQKC